MSTGDMTHGQRGPVDRHKRSRSLSVFKPSDFNNEKVTHIGCGGYFSCIITSLSIIADRKPLSTKRLAEGRNIYMVGSNYDKQLGLGISDEMISVPQKVRDFLGSTDKIVQLYCGHNNTVILTARGELWAIGDNFNGRLGLDSTVDSFEEFHMVPDVPRSKDFCVNDEFYALTNGWFLFYHYIYLLITAADNVIWRVNANGKFQVYDVMKGLRVRAFYAADTRSIFLTSTFFYLCLLNCS